MSFLSGVLSVPTVHHCCLLHYHYYIPSQCCCIVTGTLRHADNLSWLSDAERDGETMAVVHEKVIDELNQELASMKLSWISPQDSAEMDMQLQSASTALSSSEVQILPCVALPCHVFVALFLTDVLCVCDHMRGCVLIVPVEGLCVRFVCVRAFVLEASN